MPLYRCTVPAGTIPTDQRAAIAAAVTEIHCDVTGAPDTFVHVFFFDVPAADEPPRHRLHGSIRAGRTDAQKEELHARLRDAIVRITAASDADVSVTSNDVPAKWIMEGGMLLPEPGEEADWLAKHHAG